MTDVRSALVNNLALIAVDATEHPSEAVTALMRAAATILQRTLGPDAAARLMCSITQEAFEAWQAANQSVDATKH